MIDGLPVTDDADLGALLLQGAARRGIDPQLLLFDPEPIDPRGNIPTEQELVDFFTGHAEVALARIMAGMFAEDDLPELNEYVMRWVQDHKGPAPDAASLLLRGITGSGKTSQSILALRDLVLWHAHQGKHFTWRFITHRNFSAALQKNSGQDPETLMTQLMNADLLVFSDLGDVNNQDFGLTQTHTSRLINHRWHHKMPSIYETNLSFTRTEAVRKAEAETGQRIAVLADFIDDRAISRLRGGWTVTLPAIDHRVKQGRSFP